MPRRAESCPIPDRDACTGALPCRWCPNTECVADDCLKQRKGGPYCRMHQARLYRRGVLDARTVADRFWDKVDRRGDDECWPWLGATSNGYGILKPDGVHKSAHRFVYESVVGAIPVGLHLDHLCHNRDVMCQGGFDCEHRRCVNPAHLQPVTMAENTRRAAARLERCRRGHDPAEYSIYFRGNGAAFRQCRACRRERAAERRQGSRGSEAA